MSELFQLKDRNIWVIGGAGYLGTATIKLLASSGARITCADLKNYSSEMVAREGLENQVTPVNDFDAADNDAVLQFAQDQVARQGAPDGLVIMTFKSFPKSSLDLLPSEFDEANHVNLTSTFLMAREAGKVMAKAGRGSVVLFSSMYGTVSPDPSMYPPPVHPNPIEYGVGKAGIQQMARYLAVQWGPSNVRCNSIAPGPFPFAQQQNDAMMERLTSKSPMGRIGRPEEIAGGVHFLLSDASSYVTGHNLAVDGGWTAW